MYIYYSAYVAVKVKMILVSNYIVCLFLKYNCDMPFSYSLFTI